MNLLVYMLNLFVQLLIAEFLYHQIGQPKKSFIFSLMVWYAAMFGSYALCYLIYPDSPVGLQLLLKFAATFLTYWFMFSERPLRRFINMMSFFLIATIIEIPVYYLVCFTFRIESVTNYSVYASSDIISAGRIMGANAVMLVSLGISFIYKHKEFKERNTFRELLLIAGFTIIHLFFLMLYYRVNRNNLTEINNLIQLAFQALLFAMLFIQYYNTLRTRKLLESEQELQMLKIEMDNNYRYYKLADSKFDEISKLRHDIQNQFTTVRQLMCTPEGTEQARNIMDNIQEQLESVRAVNYCGNKTLNAVLTVKLNEERVRGIQTQVILRDCDGLDIDDYDLCSLVTNMFDNAVESCLRTAHPGQSFIEIKSGVQNDYFVLKITNSCEDEEIGRSRKGRGHGYGMKIAEEICRRYGGEFRLRKEGDTAVSSAFMKVGF